MIATPSSVAIMSMGNSAIINIFSPLVGVKIGRTLNHTYKRPQRVFCYTKQWDSLEEINWELAPLVLHIADL